jgi:type II secretory pathway pseudopilin PulG
MFRVIMALALAGLLVVSLTSSQSSNEQLPANEFVRQIIDNELQAERNDHSHWMLRLQMQKSGRAEVREVVETKDGDLDWLVSVNGKPVSDDQQRERARGLQRLVSHPDELQKSQREK